MTKPPEMGALCLSFRRRKLLRYNCGMTWADLERCLSDEQRSQLAQLIGQAIASGYAKLTIEVKANTIAYYHLSKSMAAVKRDSRDVNEK